MPELPEAERARQTLERALDRAVAAVDDRDTYVCRPYAPGEIADALLGHDVHLGAPPRQVPVARDRRRPDPGLHLGMAGRIVVDPDDTPPGTASRSPSTTAAGRAARQAPPRPRASSTPTSAMSAPTPPTSAATSSGADRHRPGAGKARLLNQDAISGVGNLLADEALWQARIAPGDRRLCARGSRPAPARAAGRGRSAIRKGGVHTGRFVAARGREGVLPARRTLARAGDVGGRTTYWCPECQL